MVNHAVTCKDCGPGFFLICGDCFNTCGYEHPPEHQARGIGCRDTHVDSVRLQSCSCRVFHQLAIWLWSMFFACCFPALRREAVGALSHFCDAKEERKRNHALGLSRHPCSSLVLSVSRRKCFRTQGTPTMICVLSTLALTSQPPFLSLLCEPSTVMRTGHLLIGAFQPLLFAAAKRLAEQSPWWQSRRRGRIPPVPGLGG